MKKIKKKDENAVNSSYKKDKHEKKDKNPKKKRRRRATNFFWTKVSLAHLRTLQSHRFPPRLS